MDGTVKPRRRSVCPRSVTNLPTAALRWPTCGFTQRHCCRPSKHYCAAAAAAAEMTRSQRVMRFSKNNVDTMLRHGHFVGRSLLYARCSARPVSGNLLSIYILYIKLPRLSVCVSVCLSVFRISQKRADRFPWNFSSIIGVIGRRERIKTSGKFRPLMCKNSKNGAKLPTSRRSLRATHAGVRNGLRFQFASSPKRWPVVRQRHGPIARGSGGVARSLRCGTVSNAFVLLSPV